MKLLVDAIEGICARTHSLLREANLHEMIPILILVINKVDRLTSDLGLIMVEGGGVCEDTIVCGECECRLCQYGPERFFGESSSL